MLLYISWIRSFSRLKFYSLKRSDSSSTVSRLPDQCTQNSVIFSLYLESTPEELVAVRDRLERDDLTVLAYRFEGDQICKAARFAAYSEALGDRFQPRTLPDSAANSEVSPFFSKHVPYPHSVVTQHLIDDEGQPTIAARDEMLEFFRMRL